MIRIIIENHVHRLLKNGVVESAPYQESFDVGDFKIVDPLVDLDMDYSDFNYIRQQLEIFHSMFQEGRTGVPKSKLPEDVAQNYDVEKV